MSNNEIDVSKCAFYDNGKCNNPNGMACNCCNNAYCYYKQLQQYKAENEKIDYELCKSIRSIYKLQQCFDGIEEIVNYGSVSYNNHKELVDFYEDKIEEIIKLIKEVKKDK